jgi:nucleoside-diphosphate-sugar epimerase
VRVLDDLSSGREANLADAGAAVELQRGDIRDAQALARAVTGVEVVFHHAALASVPLSVAEPLRTHSVNVDGTPARSGAPGGRAPRRVRGLFVRVR